MLLKINDGNRTPQLVLKIIITFFTMLVKPIAWVCTYIRPQLYVVISFNSCVTNSPFNLVRLMQRLPNIIFVSLIFCHLELLLILVYKPNIVRFWWSSFKIIFYNTLMRVNNVRICWYEYWHVLLYIYIYIYIYTYMYAR